MKLLQKDRRELERICAGLERAMAFIMEKDTAIMRRHNLSSVNYFTSSFPEYAGEKWYKMTKECGSPFAGAFSDVRSLRAALDAPVNRLQNGMAGGAS